MGCCTVCFTGCIFIAGVAICVLLSSDDTPLYVAIDATKISTKDNLLLLPSVSNYYMTFGVFWAYILGVEKSPMCNVVRVLRRGFR